MTTRLVEQYMVNRLPKEVTAQDRLLFYFSGHGADIGGATGYLQFAGAKREEFDSTQYLAVTRCEEWSRINIRPGLRPERRLGAER
ncbi:MAG: hypothetical protein HY236_15225 [Acidobacteria bacterium]|nr:hypothetical protein [Acidobacteriota bacterium]